METKRLYSEKDCGGRFSTHVTDLNIIFSTCTQLTSMGQEGFTQLLPRNFIIASKII